MYQSPVAAVAELISNAWDADAERVRVELPISLDSGASFVIADDGVGMTLKQCQDRFLEVGINRRKHDPAARTPVKGRPILGRKGIGKFAGFGIAKIIRVETVSQENGERTVFRLDADRLRGEEYVGIGRKPIEVLEYEGPSIERIAEHGTTINLEELLIAERPYPMVFGKSMARRFLLHERVDDFEIIINEEHLPNDADVEKAQFSFPRDYELVEDKRPANLECDEAGWGVEQLPDGNSIRWRFVFYEEPVSESELKGVAVFAHGKLAQTPFDFGLVGGLGGQQGLEYLSGAVEANYLDEFPTDYIAPERQRIDWHRPETKPLLDWGQARVKSLLRIWQDLRGKSKLSEIEGKVGHFKERLENLPKYERKIVESALKKLATVSKLDTQTFRSLAEAVLTAWEGGRLKELIEQVSASENLSSEELVKLLLEAEVMTSLHAAEAVKTKLSVIEGLRSRIKQRELENPLRDYVAQHPWLISPKWETFRRETSVLNLVKAAAIEAELHKEDDWDRRIDLVLSSGDSLVILEFMRPGVTVDFDHANRFEYYVTAIRDALDANSGGQFRRVSAGYLIADGVVKKPSLLKMLQNKEPQGLYVMDWSELLRTAEAQWTDFIGILGTRAPDDPRLRALGESVGIANSSPASVAS